MAHDSEATACEMVRAVIRGIVTDADAVRVTTFTDGDVTTLQVHVGDRDWGKVVGRGGRIARSLRIILHAAAREHGLRLRLDIPGSAAGPDEEPR